MTLRQLLDEVRLSDLGRELAISVNGEEAVPVKGMARHEDDAGAQMLILTNDEDGARMLALANDEDPGYGEGGQ